MHKPQKSYAQLQQEKLEIERIAAAEAEEQRLG